MGLSKAAGSLLKEYYHATLGEEVAMIQFLNS
jgi:hypothetical protein